MSREQIEAVRARAKEDLFQIPSSEVVDSPSAAAVVRHLRAVVVNCDKWLAEDRTRAGT